MANGWLKQTGRLHLSYRGKYHCCIELDATPFFKQSPSFSELDSVETGDVALRS